MRGKRKKALWEIANNEFLKVLIEQNKNGGQIPPARLLVHKGPPGSPTYNQAVNHPATLRAMYRLIKKSWHQFSRNPTRQVRA